MKNKLTNKQKSKIRREVDLEMGVKPPKSAVFVNKKKYNRKKKHKNGEKDILA
jgi:isopentenyldiphosphate isomerase